MSIKGGMNFLRHYYPLITKWHALLTKGGWHFSFNTKGELILKCLIGVLNSSKKTNENNSTWGKSNFFFFFFGRIENTKRTFQNQRTFSNSNLLLLCNKKKESTFMWKEEVLSFSTLVFFRLNKAKHSMATRANLNKSENFLRNTTTASKHISKQASKCKLCCTIFTFKIIFTKKILAWKVGFEAGLMANTLLFRSVLELKKGKAMAGFSHFFTTIYFP